MSTFVFSSHHMEITEAIASYVKEKFAFLDNFSIQEAKVHLEVDGKDQVVEFSCKFHSHPIFIKEKDDDLYKAIDACHRHAMNQVKKFHDKDSKHA